MTQVPQQAGRWLAIVAGAFVMSQARRVHAAPTWQQEANPSVVMPETGDFLGSCVALSGDTAVVGAPRRKNGAGVSSGSAYVMSRQSGQWALRQTLVPQDLSSYAELGWSCAVSGDRLVIGAPMSGLGPGSLAGPGAAYVYAFDGARWILEQKVVASDPVSGSRFGGTVAIDQTTLVVGSANDAAYVFSRGQAGWSAPQKLVGHDSTVADLFGTSVAVSGTSILVGAPGRTGTRGAAYVFTSSGASWTEAQVLTTSGTEAGGYAGYAVAVTSPAAGSGTAVLGGAGSAYVFSRAAGVWTEQQQLNSPSSPGDSGFGVPVALSSDFVLVGAPLRNSRAGSVFVFAKREQPGLRCPSFGRATPRRALGSAARSRLPGRGCWSALRGPPRSPPGKPMSFATSLGRVTLAIFPPNASTDSASMASAAIPHAGAETRTIAKYARRQRARPATGRAVPRRFRPCADRRSQNVTSSSIATASRRRVPRTPSSRTVPRAPLGGVSQVSARSTESPRTAEQRPLLRPKLPTRRRAVHAGSEADQPLGSRCSCAPRPRPAPRVDDGSGRE